MDDAAINSRVFDTPKRAQSSFTLAATTTRTGVESTEFFTIDPFDSPSGWPTVSHLAVDKENPVPARTPKLASKRHSTQLPPLISPRPNVTATSVAAFQPPVLNNEGMLTRSQAKRERRRSIQTASATNSRLVRVGLAPVGAAADQLTNVLGTTPPESQGLPFKTPTKVQAPRGQKDAAFAAPSTTGRRPLPKDQASPAREILGFTFRRPKTTKSVVAETAEAVEFTEDGEPELEATKLDFSQLNDSLPDSFVRSASMSAVTEPKPHPTDRTGKPRRA
jgi:hypothetical protein